MDLNGILGIVIALGIITLVFWGAQPLLDFLERFFDRGKTQGDLEQVDHSIKSRIRVNRGKDTARLSEGC